MIAAATSWPEAAVDIAAWVAGVVILWILFRG